jgi:hypothetical protein
LSLREQNFLSNSSIDYEKDKSAMAKLDANAGFKRGVAGRLFCNRRRGGGEGEMLPVMVLVGKRQRERKSQSHCPKIFRPFKVNVRNYYLKMRFIEGFAPVLLVQHCAIQAQCNRKFLSYSPVDMKEKSQSNRKASRSMRIGRSFMPDFRWTAVATTTGKNCQDRFHVYRHRA